MASYLLIMSSLVTNLNSSTAQEIVNWVMTADSAFTPPTRRDSRRRLRRRCVLGFTDASTISTFMRRLKSFKDSFYSFKRFLKTVLFSHY